MGSFDRLEEMRIWRLGIELVEDVFKWIWWKKFLTKEWALVDQIKKSAVSIPSNIAEWFGRNTNNEFKRFLYIALWSCYELYTQIELLVKIYNCDDEEVESIIEKLNLLVKQIRSLINYLNST